MTVLELVWFIEESFIMTLNLEPENSLMFKITLVPFGNINSPSFNK